MPKTLAPTSFASSSERTRFTDTFFSRLPPPTEKMRTPSSFRRRDTLSHSEKHVSQPSSFTRAVSSETLSVGVYASKPQILRKSFTAWLAWPAEPPTPRMKRRPPRALTSARPVAILSIASTSSRWMTTADSSRKVRANELMSGFLSLPIRRDQLARPFELANEEPGVGNGLPRQLDQTRMVGEEDHLLVPRELAQHLEGGARAVVVEMNEDVIDDERHRIPSFGEPLEGREVKREV